VLDRGLEAVMKNAAVLHVNSSSFTSTSPTMRIARFVADELRIPLIHDQRTAKLAVAKKYDVLFVKYGMLKFSNHRDEALEIYSRARHVINLENDYLFALDRRFRAPDATWSTVAGRDQYVNWNMLTRHPVDAWAQQQPRREITRKGLVYYGAHRPDRVESFRRYFVRPPFPLTISTFRGKEKFAETLELNKNGKVTRGTEIVGAFRDPDAPAAWPVTLYIEDATSHELYCSPATRFYECVMMGLAQAVDIDAAHTLQAAGIKLTFEDMVSHKREIADRDWTAIGQRQRSRWFKDYSKLLRQQLSDAVKGSGL
jgi:hypothetical protein